MTLRRIAHGVYAGATVLAMGLAWPSPPTVHAQPPAAFAPPAKYALLIGINRYAAALEVPKLSFAENDVDAMAEALKKVGYSDPQVLKGLGINRSTVVAAIEYFATITKPEDTFVLYVAGHGVRNPLNDRVYFLTPDAALSTLETTSLRLSHLLDFLEDVRAGHKLVMLDHCMSGDVVSDLAAASSVPSVPATGGGATATPAPGPTPGTGGARAVEPVSRATAGVARIERRNVQPIATTLSGQWKTVPGGTMILAAARDDAFESDHLKHGVFTAAVLEALGSRVADKSGDTQLSADELRAYVQDRVPAIAKTLKPPQQQEVSDYNNGSFASFMLTATLPLTTAQETKTESERLKKMIQDWYGDKRYMQAEEAILCYEALQKLGESAGAPLDQPYEAIVRVLRDVAALTSRPERARVELLVLELHRLRGVR